jgi:hypothetical protein
LSVERRLTNLEQGFRLRRRKTVLNRIVLIGRLTRDPEMRFTTSGTAVANFTLAVDRQRPNAQGEREADFIRVVVWSKLAETCANYLGKGLRRKWWRRMSDSLTALRKCPGKVLALYREGCREIWAMIFRPVISVMRGLAMVTRRSREDRRACYCSMVLFSKWKLFADLILPEKYCGHA